MILLCTDLHIYYYRATPFVGGPVCLFWPPEKVCRYCEIWCLTVVTCVVAIYQAGLTSDARVCCHFLAAANFHGLLLSLGYFWNNGKPLHLHAHFSDDCDCENEEVQ